MLFSVCISLRIAHSELMANTRKAKFALWNVAHDRMISAHRTAYTAGQADLKYGRAVKRANGQRSYVPTTLYERQPDGTYDMCQDEIAHRDFDLGRNA